MKCKIKVHVQVNKIKSKIKTKTSLGIEPTQDNIHVKVYFQAPWQVGHVTISEPRSLLCVLYVSIGLLQSNNFSLLITKINT